MVNKDEQLQLIPKQARIKKRTLFCWIILSMAMTYFLTLALLFLAALIFSGKIIDIITPYYVIKDDLPVFFNLLALSGSALYFTAVCGILFFMLKRRSGFYIFFGAALVIFSLDLTFLAFDWLRYLILSGFIFILGIAHFSKRCYNRFFYISSFIFQILNN
jgi:hypothetical protein